MWSGEYLRQSSSCDRAMRMNLAVVFVLTATAWATTGLESNSTHAVGEVHSRAKRHLLFPKGTSLQLVYCNTYLFKPVVDIFRFGTTAGLAWMLPYEPTSVLDQKKRKVFRRSVFQKLEGLIQTRGSNGRHCVLRALCESGQRTPSKKSFARELLHRIFSMDSEEEDADNHEDRMYRRAHRSVNQNCEVLYPECGFSVFDYV